MSLRDQLLKAGLANKKDARRVDQQAKRQRKQSQGSKQRKREREAERKAALAAEAEAKAQLRREARQQANRARDAFERALQIRNTLVGNRLQNRGDHPFHFKGPDGHTVLRIRVQPKVAEAIAAGRIAIAGLDLGNRIEPVLINEAGAEKLVELGAAGVLLHWARDLPTDDGDGVLERDWEPSIGPHRLADPVSSR